MNKSEQLHELFAALAKAQAEMQIAQETSDNPFFKSKYADLAEVIRASRPALSKYGLSVTHIPVINEQNEQILTVILGHSSGQFITGEMKVQPQKTDVQSLGSYLTYLRRYLYVAVTGCVAGNDDDGEASVQRTHQQVYSSPKQDIITPEQHDILQEELRGHAKKAEDLLSQLGISEFKYVPKVKFKALLEHIRNYKSALDSVKPKE